MLQLADFWWFDGRVEVLVLLLGADPDDDEVDELELGLITLLFLLDAASDTDEPR